MQLCEAKTRTVSSMGDFRIWGEIHQVGVDGKERKREFWYNSSEDMCYRIADILKELYSENGLFLDDYYRDITKDGE